MTKLAISVPLRRNGCGLSVRTFLRKLGDQLIAASRHGQLAMNMLREYLIPVSGLRFEDEVASSWEPRPFVVLDPAVQFGEPCIRDTRVPTRAVWGLVRGGDPEPLVMQSYGLTQDELTAALAWEEKSRRLTVPAGTWRRTTARC